MRLRVATVRELTWTDARVACLGESRVGRFAWLATQESGVASGDMAEVGEQLLLAVPEALDGRAALTALEYLPAWPITQAAHLELGSRVLVFGGGGLARLVLATCSLYGCLWRACCGPPDMATSAEYHCAEPPVSAERIGALLPAFPDAVILLNRAVTHLATAVAVCRSLGTVVLAGTGNVEPFHLNLYPDIHRRGLQITALPPLWTNRALHTYWEQAATRLGQWGKLHAMPDTGPDARD
jgi:NADPH:quinone reductase-like Zn-dependent oxidoreductase